ncbi:MAG TPA: aldo/keto reductase [Gemmataceae bacterium]|nr:aldo/keto reductase [Gemmataceae bacterium]
MLSRRGFLGQAAVAVGALAVADSLTYAGERRNLKSLTDRVELGHTGIHTSVLGMGTGSTGVGHSSNQVRLGNTQFCKLVRYAYDKGLTYFDTADQYGSHIYLRDALKGLPRERLFIQTKTHAYTPDMAKADIERFRQELGTEYVDTLLLHCMTTGNWPTDLRATMDCLNDFKRKGWVRAVGVSCHSMAPLRAATKCDWIDVDLARINPVGVKARMDGTPEEVIPCLRAIHDKGKGVIGMKILGEGTFRKPEQRKESLRFVLNLGCVDCFCIGFEKPEQIDEILRMGEEVLKG